MVPDLCFKAHMWKNPGGLPNNYTQFGDIFRSDSATSRYRNAI